MYLLQIIIKYIENEKIRCVFLAYGTRISASTSGAGKCHHTPHVRRVACDDVTISRALLLYKIAFILLGSGRKQ